MKYLDSNYWLWLTFMYFFVNRIHLRPVIENRHTADQKLTTLVENSIKSYFLENKYLIVKISISRKWFKRTLMY